jgi:phosphate acetyltransferase
MPDTADRPAAVAHDKYQRLIKAAQTEATIKVAIVHPCDDVSLEGAVEAARLHLIEPILVGPEERILRAAELAGLDISAMEIV